jgi:mannitol/fructose-specific phosphotransferase system IIA component (Ntr-type)
MIIEDDLLLIKLEAETKERALSVIGNRLHEKGYVTDNFVQSVIEREKVYPTGLTVGIGFIGINLVIGLLGNSLGPAAQAMVENWCGT